ncbi:hypothetical protein [Polycladidibacter hongkongensis]|uniref:hypothetical protein n=1 Tax=Polycladidibacter hongkongensis TaxID=1647556 RepID=UPI000835B28D|nr:hypothetical protein [Pseudovibrio hongkongensis]
MIPSKRRLIALSILLGYLSQTALANDPYSEGLLNRPYDLRTGWRKDVHGLTHIEGMHCPDWLGEMERTAILPDIEAIGLGCTYERKRARVSAIIRQHPHGAAQPFMRELAVNFAASGFSLLKDNGLYKGMTFVTGEQNHHSIYESIWTFEGETADYTLWVSQRAPVFPEKTDKLLRDFFALAKRVEASAKEATRSNSLQN